MVTQDHRSFSMGNLQAPNRKDEETKVRMDGSWCLGCLFMLRDGESLPPAWVTPSRKVRLEHPLDSSTEEHVGSQAAGEMCQGLNVQDKKMQKREDGDWSQWQQWCQPVRRTQSSWRFSPAQKAGSACLIPTHPLFLRVILSAVMS